MHLRILGGEIVVRGYPLAMVHAEKIVTAISRGTTSTRWRDFADMYLLARHHAADGAELGHLAHRAAMGQGAAASGPEHRSRSQRGRAHLAS
jgi:hypothetical protein